MSTITTQLENIEKTWDEGNFKKVFEELNKISTVT